MISLFVAVLYLAQSTGVFAVPNGVIQLDLEKVPHPLVNKRDVIDYGNPILQRANQDIADKLDNQKFFYSTTVGIGTPAQKLNLLLDTGSSDTWVFTKDTQVTGNYRPSAIFDPSASKTWKSNGTTFQIQYGIGNTQGQWGTDKFEIGGATVNSLSIGLATNADTANGIIGIGRPEAEITNRNGRVYENLPMRLAAEGHINSAAYSLYLNDLNSKSGTILFGGVDTSKFIGNLKILPITHPKHLAITMQGLSTDGLDKRNLMTSPSVSVLDSGTSLSYFSSDVIQQIHQALNANPSFTIGQKYYCDCNITNNLILNFGSAEIEVPNYDFLWPIETIVSPLVAGVAFPQNSCYLGIEQVQAGMDFSLIGDNLLRAFYTVYDIQNDRIAIGQANPRSGTSNIKLITKNYIPGAV
ncbi:Yps3p [Sugiyamaella lignohabitans]|uniref:Yps3p n=1 Tax=Sugiyamaella lignohabitans TaxID=796027 RepID=A0A167E3R7_9ASCO|nr:Yps3p [Sugiyamaella lignohabitans]ANB13605.1 Yps3p [Sugiyamaella lignohabitans]